ncbi:hypothetical protein D1007_22416 [Hordeum vulgare]|nr:hypothetical protein D1007_22416 [Hordeum vulgare]
MHHVGPNSFLYLACFAILCEAYLGFWPYPSFFRHLFHFCAQVHRHKVYYFGGTIVYRRVGRLLSKMKWKESFKKWQCTFFYVRCIGLAWAWVNLPPFSDEPPTRTHWDLDLHFDELAAIADRMPQLVSSMGLVAPDLLAAFISLRVLSL